MYGPKGRIGILVPSGNCTMENEFHKMVPEGFAIMTGRMYSPKRGPSGIPNNDFGAIEASKIMADDLENAARKFARAKINVIVFGCTGASFFGGVEWEKSLVRRLNSVLPDIPAITASGSATAALKKLKVDKLSVGSPYGSGLHARLLKFMEDSGFKVVSSKCDCAFDITAFYKLVKEIDSPVADAIFISCTELRTIENIERLERETGKPLVTANQASMWNALKKIGYKEPIKGYGKLLTRL